MTTIYDLAVIGGGVNGCGIARDAAGRGYSVFLCEQDDLAGATSSASTKLIHGGLRYLEQFDFRLVREALNEREVLLRIAPHLIHPMRFVLPYHRGLRPWPVIRLGLFLYDHLSTGRTLPGTRSVDLRRDVVGRGLRPEFTRAFEYSDCSVDDARLVVLNARDAADRGADIHTRTRCVSAVRDNQMWRLTVDDLHRGERRTIFAKALVNAAGPWVASVIRDTMQSRSPASIRMVKGSHIVVDRLFDHDHAYIFQNGDGRICFAIPYRHDFTLIGTTDEDYRGDPARVEISEAESDYLLSAVGAYLDRPIVRSSIRWSYSGVRPLHDGGSGKAQKASRDYRLELDRPLDGGAPSLSVFGGKLTTYRRLAEHALEELRFAFPGKAGPWTSRSPLPGGDIPVSFAHFAADMARRFAGLPPAMVARCVAAYGTRVEALFDGAELLGDLGEHFAHGLTEREVEFLVRNEWTQSAGDILWRRTKLGLRFTSDQVAALATYLSNRSRA